MVDIKEWLQDAASSEHCNPGEELTAELDPGQVIKPDSLTYLEAMNALEVGPENVCTVPWKLTGR